MTLWTRPARTTDAGSAGEVLYQFQALTPWMPKLHSAAEAIAFCGQMIDQGWVTVAGRHTTVEAFLARDGEDIHALYVQARAQGVGLGSRLVEHAKASTERLALQTFQANARAQRFYERCGFVECARGDGAQNDENLPDITYVWHKPRINTKEAAQ